MAGRQFRRRVLMVDGDATFLESCAQELENLEYEVLIAGDGFGALTLLRGARPDLLITELNLPRMSGFELLSVVRTRFPEIAVIALSDTYTPASLPAEAICDAFVAKDYNVRFELAEAARELASRSPIRGSRPKPDLAPVWVPRSSTGYVVLTCPECLRSFSAMQPKPGTAQETCVCCGADVSFQMSLAEVVPTPATNLLQTQLARLQRRSHELQVESQEVRQQASEARATHRSRSKASKR